jgi:uncharacterized membrane protein YphA (DoxX/SURF4 family)
MKERSLKYSAPPGFTVFLFLLRIAVAWHFLYEGLTKLINPGWTSLNYLLNSTWLLSGIFGWMASDPVIVSVVDFLNIWGLVFIGLGLLLGLFTRISAVSGTAILLLYYFAYPPFTGIFQPSGIQGVYMFVNMNLVEAFALMLIFFSDTGKITGLDYFRPIPFKTLFKKGPSDVTVTGDLSGRRREVLKALVSLPFAGVFAVAFNNKHGWESFEEKNISVDGISGASYRSIDYKGLDKLNGKLPKARIGNVELSRLILGGNLMGGWAHSRDLIYVSELVKAYHTEDRIFTTLQMAEKSGINTILSNPVLFPVLKKYWKLGGSIKLISDGSWDYREGIQRSVDQGASICYLHGGRADQLVKEQKFDEIAWALDTIRKNGLPAGIGGHELKTVKACEERGLIPDFWMKTLHKTSYWSARVDNERKNTLDKDFADNIFCQDPEQTISYMNKLEQPWIAYKILAAGAIHPNEAFPWAFENGADFICVGMYDFQLVDNVNLASALLAKDIIRERPWRA